jgi:hypothetical protein
MTPPVEQRLHVLGDYRIRQVIKVCAYVPHSHVTPQLLLALGDRETLLQNIVSGSKGSPYYDDDTGWTQLNRKVWHDTLKQVPGCPSGSWTPKPGHHASEPGFCPEFTISARITHGILLSHLAVAGYVTTADGAGEVPWPERLYVAVAGYNAGIGGALNGWNEDRNPDKYTAAPRHDYSADVIDVRKPQIEHWLRKHDYID